MWVILEGRALTPPKVPGMSREHLGREQNGDDQRIIEMIHGSLHQEGQEGLRPRRHTSLLAVEAAPTDWKAWVETGS